MRYKGVERTCGKGLLTALMLICIQPVGIAQETTDTMAASEKKPGLVKRLLDRINKPYDYFDDRYVREPRTKFIVTLTGDVQQTGVRIKDMTELEADWSISNSTLTNIQLQERVYRKAGIYVTYLGIRAGWGARYPRRRVCRKQERRHRISARLRGGNRRRRV